MHLGNCYGRALGVRMGKPVLQSHFYPLPFDKYITIHTSNKVPAKNYSYWCDVVSILKPELEKKGFKIIQVGTEADQKIEGVDTFLNDTSFQQTFYILENSKLHVGIDSCPVHIASAYNIPTVSIYSHTYASTCSPLWNKNKIIIESDRGGNRPSFSLVEDPKTIDFIKPEEIAEACFKLLKIKDFASQKTIYVGPDYLSKTIDVILGEHILFHKVSDAKIRVRADLYLCEKCLAVMLEHGMNSVSILTNKPISKKILERFKEKIEKIVYSSDDFNELFLSFLKNSKIPFELVCTNDEKLSEQRNKFFNFEIQSQEKICVPNDKREFILANTDKILVNTGKIYFVNGEKVTSLVGFEKDDFWIDSRYFRFYIPT